MTLVRYPKAGYRFAAHFAATSALSFALLGCSSNSKPPEDPSEPVLLEPPSEEVQAPSSELVKEGMDKIKAGDFAGAHEVLTKARTQSPEDPQAAFYDGVALENLKQTEDAIAAYETAIKIHPKMMIEAYQNLSALLQEQERTAESLKVADAGLVEAPEDPALLINRAYALDLLGEPDKGNPTAIAAYEKALAASPDNLDARYYFAYALARNGEKDRALKELAQLPLDGKKVPVVEIVTVYSQLGAFKECTSALSSAIDQNKTVELLIHRSVCKAQAKDDKGAEADLREAVKTDPNSSIAHYYLARFLDKAGKKAEAKKELETANALKANEPK